MQVKEEKLPALWSKEFQDTRTKTKRPHIQNVLINMKLQPYACHLSHLSKS